MNWFKNIRDKQHRTFLIFDIVEYYPSIIEDLLLKAVNFAKQNTPITDKEVQIIQHARKSLLFHNDLVWAKKNNGSFFGVTMGSYDGAEICELLGTVLLNKISEKIGQSKHRPIQRRRPCHLQKYLRTPSRQN